MTHCYNCGHAGTFVLLVEFALPVAGHPAESDSRSDSGRGVDPDRGTDSGRRAARRPRDPSCEAGRPPSDASSRHGQADATGPRDPVDASGRRHPADASGRPGPSGPTRVPAGGDLSLAVQCPACDSTDVSVAAADLLARYGASTTS